VLTRRDLIGLGFSEKGIKHRVATGRLHPVSVGVYAVGRPELTPHGRWMAAVLACGDGSVLCHRSAAELWGIGREGDLIDVSIRRRSKLRRRGLKVRSRPSLPGSSVTRWHGIPVTDPVQTLIDLATELRDLRLERAVNEADKLDLVDPETLRLSDSDLEVLFRPLALAAHLPVPLTKHWVLGYETDFHFPGEGLIVETDGLRYHRTPSQQARAAKRDQTHTAAGYRVLRFTHWQIAHAPNEVTAVLRRIRPHLGAAS
jgi:very-short-patch-repair endonuclease